jgi:hypothetical protein
MAERLEPLRQVEGRFVPEKRGSAQNFSCTPANTWVPFS